MALPSGSRLGPYEIVAAIGAGGMGEVYKAREPRWSRDGRELFYFTQADHQRAAALWVVPISPGPTFAAGRPVKLFEGNYGAFNQGRQTYDVSPDGKRFVMIQPVETPTPIIVVQNWTDELKRLVPDPISHGPLARTISFWR